MIVPVFNVAEYLPRCLDSILAQTYTDLEIICVDDGSTDDSGGILDSYTHIHSNIRVIHKENGGVTSARLAGIRAASGEWIGFVDGDDEIEPDMYERLMKNALTHGAQISHCGYQMRFSDGRVHYFHNSGLLAKQDRTTAISELLSGTMIEPGLCNKLFRKSLFHSLLQGEAMDTGIKINEDLLMNFYLFSEAEQTVFEDWCPYHYIVREGSASRAKLNIHKIYDPIKVKKIILENCDKDNLVDAQKAFLTTCIYAYCGLISAKEAKQHRQAVRREILEHKSWTHLLPKRTKLLAVLALYMPVLLDLVYPIYEKYFQSKKYD